MVSTTAARPLDRQRARTRVGAFVRRRLDPDVRYGLRLSLFVVAFLLIAVPFGLLLGQVLTAGPVTEVDTNLSTPFYALSEPAWANVAFETVSFIGKPILLAVVVALPGVWLLWKREYRIAAFLVLTVVSGGLVDTVLKAAIGRPRPLVSGHVPEAFGNSFPSGHAMSSIITYGAVTLILLPYISRRWRKAAVVGAVVLVLTIALSRLALGMHFLSDVIAGLTFGLAWLLLSVVAFNVWRTDRHEPEVHADVDGVEPENPPAQAVAMAADSDR